MLKRTIALTLLTASTLLVVSPASFAQSWQKYMDAGEAAYQNGKNDQAEKALTSALKEAEKANWNDLRTARTLNDLAVIYDESEKYNDAESFYKRALAIRETAAGPKSLEVADTLNNLGNLYTDTNRYTDAEPLYLRAIDIYSQQKDSSSDSNLAGTLYHLGDMYVDQGKPESAIEPLQRALTLGDKTLGPANEHVVNMVSSLADAYDKLGRKSEAKPLYERYLLNVRHTLGMPDNFPNATVELHKIASELRKEGQGDNADRIEKALSYEMQKR